MILERRSQDWDRRHSLFASLAVMTKISLTSPPQLNTPSSRKSQFAKNDAERVSKITRCHLSKTRVNFRVSKYSRTYLETVKVLFCRKTNNFLLHEFHYVQFLGAAGAPKVKRVKNPKIPKK